MVDTAELRVLRLIDSLGVGGAERLEVTFAAEARHLPMALMVVALEERPYNLLSELTPLGITVIQLRSPRTRLGRLLQVIRVASLIRRHRVDVVHASLTYANFVATVAGRLTGTPVICSLHGTADESPSQLGIMRLADRWVLRYGATRIVAVGDSVVRSHRHLLGGGRTVSVLRNAVPVPRVLPAGERAAVRKSLTRSSEALIFMAVGRIVPDKAYGDMLLAFASVVEEFEEAVLVIAGGGELEADLARMVKALGITESVQLLGFRNDVPTLLGAADVFVLSSRSEGSPVAVLEAMAAGLPTVATDVGDLARVLADCGVLVPPGRPDLLARAMAGLLASREHREILGAAARRQIEECHSAGAWARSTYEIYREVGTRKCRSSAATSGRV